MRLREIRESRGLNQRQVAEVLNCSVTVYSRYETEKRQIPLEALNTLADFYGVTIDTLLGREATGGLTSEEKAHVHALVDRMTEEQCRAFLTLLEQKAK